MQFAFHHVRVRVNKFIPRRCLSVPSPRNNYVSRDEGGTGGGRGLTEASDSWKWTRGWKSLAGSEARRSDYQPRAVAKWRIPSAFACVMGDGVRLNYAEGHKPPLNHCRNLLDLRCAAPRPMNYCPFLSHDLCANVLCISVAGESAKRCMLIPGLTAPPHLRHYALFIREWRPARHSFTFWPRRTLHRNFRFASNRFPGMKMGSALGEEIKIRHADLVVGLWARDLLGRSVQNRRP